MYDVKILPDIEGDVCDPDLHGGAIEVANKRLKDIWKKYDEKERGCLRPLTVGSLKTNGILFVGLNPSFSDKGFNKIKEEHKKINSVFDTIEPLKFFAYTNKDYDPVMEAQLDNAARDHLPYFSKFKEIAEYVNVSQCLKNSASKIEWEHLDLFYSRQTSQNDFKNVIYKNNEISDCGKGQLVVSKCLIEYASPRVIVVANALASRIFKDHLEFEIKFNDDVGYDFIKLGDNKEIPIFFSSMLTGQRALDNFSFQRLMWHVCSTFKTKVP
jgi:hypothetical protein